MRLCVCLPESLLIPHLLACLPRLPPTLGCAPQKARWDSYLRWGIEYDCPIFHGLFKFCRQYSAASIGEAAAAVAAVMPTAVQCAVRLPA